MSKTSEHVPKLSQSLVEWFTNNKRDLPWRKTRNPYFIWISEVMLQQTQVDTVIPYYERFITQFPTMFDLARADEDVLLKEWEGLGYYSRARNLQAGVREVVENYHATVPNDKEQLLKVKGIGPYTAGAILSIAYDQPIPAVDGNVMRVTSRLFNIEEDITKASTKKQIEAKIQEYIPPDKASDFNQALMELGALICKPKSPKCQECPLANYCMAYKEGTQDMLPVKSKKVKQKKLFYTVLVLQNEKQEFYIQKRPNTGLLAGLWEFPMIPVEDPNEGLRSVEEFLRDKHIQIPIHKIDLTLSHIFSHLKWELNVVMGECREPVELSNSGMWVKWDELEAYPFPVPHQKVRNHIQHIPSKI